MSQLPPDLKYKWEFCLDLDTWMCGTPESGCGVYLNDISGAWEGNVLVANTVHTVDGATFEQCLRAAEAEFDRLKEAYK